MVKKVKVFHESLTAWYNQPQDAIGLSMHKYSLWINPEFWKLVSIHLGGREV